MPLLAAIFWLAPYVRMDLLATKVALEALLMIKKKRELAREGQVGSGNAVLDAERVVPINRPSGLEIAPVDIAVVGFMGRDFTISGLATIIDMKSATLDTAENVIGFNNVDFGQAYRETCSLRLGPETAGQLALSLVQALKESDLGSYQSLLKNLEQQVGLVEGTM